MAAAPKRDYSAGSRDFSEPSCSKKCRMMKIPELPEELIIKTATCMSELTDIRRTAYRLTPLQITNCNAAVPQESFSFSNASCSVLSVEPMHVFGSIFGKGIRMLLKYLDEGVLPEKKLETLLLNKLLNYLLDTDSHSVLEKTATFSETELTVLLANHLFVKLTASPYYTIDKHSQKKQTSGCPCENAGCTIKGHYGDTSLGHEDVWHGSVGIIINSDVILETVKETYTDSPSGTSPLEMNSSIESNPQIIAETIVFSFLQKQRHTESDHFLFPCIGVAGKDLVFYFYDSGNDVLLESSQIPLFIGKSGQQLTINFAAVLASWLVVNYKYLCSGLTKGMLVPKKMAGFFSHAKLKLPIYESALKLGNVGIPNQSKKLCDSVDTTDEIILEAKEKILKIQAKGSGRPAVI